MGRDRGLGETQGDLDAGVGQVVPRRGAVVRTTVRASRSERIVAGVKWPTGAGVRFGSRVAHANDTAGVVGPGGQVLVAVQRQGDTVRAIIEDSAPGVDEDKRGRLFERFYRAEESRNRASGGSGLGLAICRNIAQAHGGTLHAEASALGGLRVVLSLPVRT